MQTKLNDDRFYVDPKNLDEAKTLILIMRKRLEEADKIIQKPDYEVVESLNKIDFSSLATAKEGRDKIVAEIKSRPISEKMSRKPALWVVPHFYGKPDTGERRRLTEDLSKRGELERHAAKGTQKVTKSAYRTQFPEGLKDRGQNCEWLIKPDKLEIVKDT